MNYKKIIFNVSLLVVLISLFSAIPPVAKATNYPPDVQAKINALTAQIISLQQQLIQLQSQQGTTPMCHSFNMNLKIGDSNNEVSALNDVLLRQGFDVFLGNYFSEKTSVAVVKFQEKYAFDILTPYGLTHGTGYVGLKTRTKLNALYGCAIISNPIQANPIITDLSPTNATVNSPAFTLTVNGTNFVNGATVSFNNVNRATTFISSTQLTVLILASDLATKGSYWIEVKNPNGSTASKLFYINSAIIY